MQVLILPLPLSWAAVARTVEVTISSSAAPTKTLGFSVAQIASAPMSDSRSTLEYVQTGNGCRGNSRASASWRMGFVQALFSSGPSLKGVCSWMWPWRTDRVGCCVLDGTGVAE